MIELAQTRLTRSQPQGWQAALPAQPGADGRLAQSLALLHSPGGRLGDWLMLGLGWMGLLAGLGILLLDLRLDLAGLLVLLLAVLGPSPGLGLAEAWLRRRREQIQAWLEERSLAAAVGLAWLDCVEAGADAHDALSDLKRLRPRFYPVLGSTIQPVLQRSLQLAAEQLATGLGWDSPTRLQRLLLRLLFAASVSCAVSLVACGPLYVIALPAALAILAGYQGRLGGMLAEEISGRLLADLRE